MKTSRRMLLPLAVTAVLFVPFTTTTSAVAEDFPDHHEGHMHSMMSDSHHGESRESMHHFSDHWAKTLNDKQKQKVDMMHLELNRKLTVLKARAELVQKEMNALAARDDADMKAIQTKIDELMDLKNQIMRARYEHILEMRAILTPTQRISYDMEVLARHGAR